MPAAMARTTYAIYTPGRYCRCGQIRPITTLCHGNTHSLRPAVATLSCPGRPPASCGLPHCSCPGNRWQRQALPLPRCRPSPSAPDARLTLQRCRCRDAAGQPAARSGTRPAAAAAPPPARVPCAPSGPSARITHACHRLYARCMY